MEALSDSADNISTSYGVVSRGSITSSYKKIKGTKKWKTVIEQGANLLTNKPLSNVQEQKNRVEVERTNLHFNSFLNTQRNTKLSFCPRLCFFVVAQFGRPRKQIIFAGKSVLKINLLGNGLTHGYSR